MAGMGVDPFTMGLLSMFAGANPEQAAPLLTKMGVPVPGKPASLDQPLGAPAMPTAPTIDANALGGMGGAMPGTGASVPSAAMGSPAAGGNPLSALAGVKAPAPITPIMTGGVAGGVKAPEVTAASKVGSPAIDALMAAILGGGAQTKVPTLGEYIRGGKY